MEDATTVFKTSREWAEEDEDYSVIRATGWEDVGFGFCEEMFNDAWNNLVISKDEYIRRRNTSELGVKLYDTESS